MDDDLLRDFFLGFVRLHGLFHAGEEPVCGVDLMAEMARHGLRVAAGPLYPLYPLRHRLDASGLLRREGRVVAGRQRKYEQPAPGAGGRGGSRRAPPLRGRPPARAPVGEVVAGQGPALDGLGAGKGDGH